jgi:hypothetical protein
VKVTHKRFSPRSVPRKLALRLRLVVVDLPLTKPVSQESDTAQVRN